MKNIKLSLTINLIIAGIVLIYSCNVKEVLTDTNGQKKSFLLLNPNFLATNYQVRLFDTANNLVEKEMIVEVISNKKIVDQEGYYKNSFTVTNGLLNLAVDPNEIITETDPIKLSIIVYSSDHTMISTKNINYVGKNNFDRVFKIALKNVSFNNLVGEIPTLKTNSSYTNTIKSAASTNLTNEWLKVGGLEYPIYLNRAYNYTSLSPYGSEKEWNIINLDYENNYYSSVLYNLNKSTLERDLSIQFSYRDLVDLNTMHYNLDVYYKDINGNNKYFSVQRDGGATLFPNGGTIIKTPSIINWDGISMIPNGSMINSIFTYSFRMNTELNNCPEGLNFKINNIVKGAKPELEYIIYRNDQAAGRYYISNIGIAKVSEQNPIYNTGELLYSNLKNKVVFKDNSQYRIVPSTFELTGSTACGSTTNIDIVPKDNVVFYKLAVEAQCSAENFGAVVNADLLFRKKGTSYWEGLTIKNGIGSLYLENNAVYEVMGTIGNRKVDFNFTNDPSLFETQKKESLSKNKDFTNVTYAITQDASKNKLLKIKLFILQNACPFK